MSARAIYHFTRDLRLREHAGLAAAGRSGEVVPVLVIDAQLAAQLRGSPRRAAFYCAAVASLAAELAARGTSLIVRRGSTANLLRSLARATGARLVAWSARYDARGKRADRELQSALEEAGIAVAIGHEAPAVDPEETAHGYRALVPYVAAWRSIEPAAAGSEPLFAALEIASEPLPVPAEFGSQCELPEGVSSAEAQTRLEAFLAGPALSYGIARNVPAVEATSHLSAELSFGVLSARAAVRAANARCEDPFLLAEERASVRLFARALAQRDFFLQLAWFYSDVVDEPLQDKMRDFRFARSHPALDAWRTGRTGYPLVDAGMRQLRATGWMHPRVRSVAASFLCFDLGVDWRVGRDEWDRHLIEDDPPLAIGNWQWIAGIGADLAYPRIYNPFKQARRFDPEAAYVRRWIPELAALPTMTVLDPWSSERREQIELPLFGTAAYPRPVVEHEPAARAFLERYARERPREATPASFGRATR